jgi:hypothetical protein
MLPQYFQTLQLQGLDLSDKHTPSPVAHDNSSVNQKFNPAFALGVSSAAEVLRNLQCSFQDLKTLMTITERPALDVGCSYSTFACEAYLRGLPVFATDLRCNQNRSSFLKQVENRLDGLKLRGELPESQISIPEAVHAFDQQLSECRAEKIIHAGGTRAQDQQYSVVISHNASPLYSSPEIFFEKELPELLRVAKHSVRLFPFESYDKNLTNTIQLSYAHTNTVARKHGFSFATTPASENSKSVCAVFTRLHGR